MERGGAGRAAAGVRGVGLPAAQFRLTWCSPAAAAEAWRPRASRASIGATFRMPAGTGYNSSLKSIALMYSWSAASSVGQHSASATLTRIGDVHHLWQLIFSHFQSLPVFKLFKYQPPKKSGVGLCSPRYLPWPGSLSLDAEERHAPSLDSACCAVTRQPGNDDAGAAHLPTRRPPAAHPPTRHHHRHSDALARRGADPQPSRAG